ncbi:monoamine oxidase [Mycobacteroides abscessus subsp. abscessus]|nr:monoamine oxidase [Mycobacteroides abscessus subsp. abscessus]
MLNHVDVVIVGAGLSGLAAGWELRKHGKSFAILEAQNRVGGRVLTITHEDSTIDLGAQWVSPFQPRIQALLKYFQIQTIPSYNEGKTIFDLHNKRMLGLNKFPPLSPHGRLDLLLTQRKIQEFTKLLSKEGVRQSSISHKCDSITTENWIEGQMFSKLGKSFFTIFCGELASLELNELSFLDILWFIQSAGGLEKILTGEEEWITNGAQTLPRLLAEAMHEQMYLNQPVRKIVWGGNRVNVHTDSDLWKSQKVIVALPPTFSSKIQYDPPLPALREQLCQRVGQGSIIKSVIVYATPFWREQGLSGNSYNDYGPIRATMDSSTPGQPHGVLTALIGGKYARRLGQLPPLERKKEIVSCLGLLFGKEALDPIALYDKDWSEDPWSRGGYAAHFATGVITEYGAALTDPVGPIHWAGTETANEWRLYMEGAIESGERAAKETLK